jgi:hypothetical protein
VASVIGFWDQFTQRKVAVTQDGVWLSGNLFRSPQYIPFDRMTRVDLQTEQSIFSGSDDRQFDRTPVVLRVNGNQVIARAEVGPGGAAYCIPFSLAALRQFADLLAGAAGVESNIMRLERERKKTPITQALLAERFRKWESTLKKPGRGVQIGDGRNVLFCTFFQPEQEN